MWVLVWGIPGAAACLNGSERMIILTGVSGGIGKAITEYLLKLDNVLGIYNTTRPASTNDVKLTLEQLDLEDARGIKSFVQKCSPKLSKITLIHAAALKIDGLAANYPESDWEKMMKVNLTGNFLLTQALLPYMISQRWGRIIHISSLGGIQGAAGTIAYSTTKTALCGMSRALAKEYARFNITSNILVLGHFETGLYEKLSDEVKKELLNQIPSKALGKVGDIANAIEFLIKSVYVNGTTINIDGGI